MTMLFNLWILLLIRLRQCPLKAELIPDLKNQKNRTPGLIKYLQLNCPVLKLVQKNPKTQGRHCFTKP